MFQHIFSVLMLSAYAHKFCFETEKGNGEAEGKREGRKGREERSGGNYTCMWRPKVYLIFLRPGLFLNLELTD